MPTDQASGSVSANEVADFGGAYLEDNEDDGDICVGRAVEQWMVHAQDHSEESDEDEDDGLTCSQDSTSDQLKSEIKQRLERCCSANCCKTVSIHEIYNHILNMREITKAEKDMYIMGKLKIKDNRKCTDPKRRKYSYIYDNREMCRDMFLLTHDISLKKLRNITKHMTDNGITPRVHGNTGKMPKHAVTYEDTFLVVNFIKNYATTHGLPQPAAPRGSDNYPPIFLPASDTRINIHQQYTASCMDIGVRSVGRTTFCAIWKSCIPHVQFASPRTDVCSKCEILRKQVQDARTDEAKNSSVEAYASHLKHAQDEREFYRSSVQAAVEEIKQGPSGHYKHVHYTFDFAQNFTIPHHVRHMGPLYFLTLRKVHMFGVALEGDKKQVNFLIDEGCTIGKDGSESHGPDSVISMVDHAVSHYGHKEKRAVFHADNCPGKYYIPFICISNYNSVYRDFEIEYQIIMFE